MQIQDNPVVDEGVPALHIDHTGKCTLRWTQTRSDGTLVDCEAQIQLIGAHIARVRQPKPKELPRLHRGKMTIPEGGAHGT